MQHNQIQVQALSIDSDEGSNTRMNNHLALILEHYLCWYHMLPECIMFQFNSWYIQ